MNARAVIGAWLIAVLLIAGAVGLALYQAARPRSFHGAPIAVIGTSLMRHAVPQGNEDRADLLGDGQEYWRVGLSAASEKDMLSLLSRAIDEHVRIVLLESSTLLFDMAKSPRAGRCDTAGAALRRPIKDLQLRVTDAIAHVLGKIGQLDEVSFPDELDRPLWTQPVRLRGIYPLALRGPCQPALLESLASRAFAQGTSMILVLTPRSVTSERLLGPVQRRALDGRAQSLAHALHASLFAPTGPWPDTQFVDGEHLNRRGRTHFLAALRQWRQNQR